MFFRYFAGAILSEKSCQGGGLGKNIRKGKGGIQTFCTLWFIKKTFKDKKCRKKVKKSKKRISGIKWVKILWVIAVRLWGLPLST